MGKGSNEAAASQAPSATVASGKRDRNQLFSMDEVKKHCTETDLWLVIDDKVYDVTKYYPHHPGGGIMHTWAGRDASDPFECWHNEVVREKLKHFLIGRVEPQRTSEYEQDKLKLVEQVKAMNLYKTDWSYFVPMLVHPWLLLGISLLCVFGSDSFWVHMAGALVLAGAWHQAAWLGHDLMHNSLFRNINTNHWIGLVYGNLLTSISAGWWKYTHNMHHATTNEYDRDPDITHLPFFAVTEKMFQLDRPFSALERALLRVLIPVQHLMYIPLMIVGRLNLYFQGFYLLFFRQKVLMMQFQRLHYPRALCWGERVSLLGFWAWYGALLYWGLAQRFDGQRALCFFLVSHVYMAVLEIQITLSHWERPMNAGEEGNREWIWRQVSASRNISPNWFTDYYWGGLHYQIEHHLFPRVPRHNLPRVKLFVEPFCRKHGIPYSSVHFFTAFTDLLKSLFRVSEQVKKMEQFNLTHIKQH